MWKDGRRQRCMHFFLPAHFLMRRRCELLRQSQNSTLPSAAAVAKCTQSPGPILGPSSACNPNGVHWASCLTVKLKTVSCPGLHSIR